MFTTADLPDALRWTPDAPHQCGRPECREGTPEPVANPGSGVPSTL